MGHRSSLTVTLRDAVGAPSGLPQLSSFSYAPGAVSEINRESQTSRDILNRVWTAMFVQHRNTL